MQNIQAILWDIDGTILDNEPYHQQVGKRIFKSLGFDLTQEHLNRFFGKGYTDLYQTLVDEFDYKESLDYFISFAVKTYEQEAKGLPARGSSMDVLSFAYKNKLKQGCVSNSARGMVEANVTVINAHLGLSDVFGALISRCDVENGKPHPDGYLKAAQQLGVEPEQCIVVEDSPTGVTAGKAAGMRVFAWPEEHKKALDFSHADVIIDDITEILPTLGLSAA